MPKQQFNLNLSKSLINVMSAKAKSEGISLEELALSAISEYVGYMPLAPKAALDQRLVVMENRIAKLEASLGESVA